MNRKKSRQKLTRELSLAWTIFMTRFSRSWMNCTRTSSSLGLTYERRGSQAFGLGRIESKDSGKHCETFFKPQTRRTGSGIEETKESSTSSHRLGGTIDRCDCASSCKSINGSSGFASGGNSKALHLRVVWPRPRVAASRGRTRLETRLSLLLAGPLLL
jgi:hypothetical protein